jgi:hypothetical protein
MRLVFQNGGTYKNFTIIEMCFKKMFQNITPAQLHDNYILTYFGGNVCVCARARMHRSASTSIPKVIAKRLMSCHVIGITWS